MARKPPVKKGKKKRKRKMRLKLKSSKIQETDSYSESLGWSTEVGRTLTDQNTQKSSEPETIKHQCKMCGSMMVTRKPKASKYTITCPHCESEEQFG